MKHEPTQAEFDRNVAGHQMSFAICQSCRAVDDRTRWEQMPQEDWRLGLVAMHRGDVFFSSSEDIIDHCLNDDVADVRSLQLVLTEPNRLREIDPSELLHELPDDIEFEDVASVAVVEALEALNQAIRDSHATNAISWSPINIRVTDSFLSELQRSLDQAKGGAA